MVILRWKTLTLLVLVIMTAVSSTAQAEIIDLTGRSVLQNGFEVRLMPGDSTSLVAGLVLVRTGYASESQSESGYSHLLEHLVFAGTANRTADSIQEEIKDMGGYINGFTRDDYTGYLFVGQADHLGRYLDILDDMLFHSTIREESLKEAEDVVVEEINRFRSRPEAREEALFQSLLYGGSSYAKTGLGNETTVRSAGRDDILGFYRRSYRPNNMILLLAGGFDPTAALRAVGESFGREERGGTRVRVLKPPPFLSARTYSLASDMPDVRVRIGFAGPDPRSADAETMELFGALLGGTDGVLDQALKDAGMQPVSVSANLLLNEGFSRFVISAVLPAGSDPAAVQMVLSEAVSAALSLKDLDDRLDRTRDSLAAEETLEREKIHYYLMDKASWVVAGYPGQGFSPGRWDGLTSEDLVHTAREYLINAPYVALQTMPGSARQELAGQREPVRAEDTLNNGLRIIAEQRPGSPVFALHVMTRQRSALEPAGKMGIADFLHRLLPMGTYNRSREQIDSTLRQSGISLTTAGDPTVPFGDFYTSRLYSYLRVECLEEKARTAVSLLSDMMLNPLLKEKAVEEVRARVLGFIAYNSSSPERLASGMLAKSLYSPVLPGGVYGTRDSIAGITRKDLQEFHSSYFTGRNLIVSVVSGMPPGQSIALVKEFFADFPAGEKIETSPLRLTQENQVLEAQLGKPQGALAMGAVTGDFDPSDGPVLAVVSSLLNTRVYRELREREGLAYSAGAFLGNVENRVVFTLSMGTSPDKLQRARDSALRLIDEARTSEVTREEITREVNGLVGRLQMRMLSSINRAYYLGVAVRLNLTHTFGEGYRKILLSLTPEEVQQAARRYLPESRLVQVLVR